MFKAKLQTSYQNLTQSERMIADYILEHLDEIKTITSHQLAVLTNTGQSTIIRFSQKLGYNSFREFLADISMIKPEDQAKHDEITVEETTGETSRKIGAQYKDIIDITLNTNNEQTIDQVCALLIKKKKIIIFGVASSNLFCEYLANQLITIGLTCFTSQYPHSIFSIIDQADPQETVLFLLSESGETYDAIKAAEIAKNNQIPIIVMTRNVRNTLSSYADYLLKTVSFTAKTSLNVTTMRCSQLLLIDILYLNILKLDYHRFEQIIERAEILSDKL
ncbi:putative HTH-type transcriptional regulator YbbH [bioreactor metagenome]|uniref:Putative HTH-type transcriptional regulator YbbH n=1 Tax=bioreactor metagenome TaxID=1076179 RepID=A0A644YDD1_9ZZZZ|nr:MurR/RpiR family transcriptional regulator [Erysipelotrichaceae bacterium]